jgi:hypothetical protein
MRKIIADGVHLTTRIAPAENHVLHDNNLDDKVFDEETRMPTAEIALGYKEGEISVGHDYDFNENPRELYAVPRSSVDKERIF